MPYTSGLQTPKSSPMPEPDIEFQKMTEAHLPVILAIEQASFSDPWSQAMFRQELGQDQGKMSLVLLQSSKVIGYGIGWLVLDEFHLGNLAVGLEHQARGYGAIILGRMLDTAKNAGCRIATLEVRVSNLPAISLYHKFGFKEMAVRKKYYHDEDALVMLARLNGEEAC
jgi:[ribosomal protein S18]-alanine N-acetyltransferase